MKRSIRSVVAMTVGLGLAVPLLTATPAEAAKTTKVKTDVTIAGYDGDNADRVVFWGKAKPKKQKKVCRTKRKVTLTQIEQGLVAGKDTTNKKGEWRLSFDGDKIDPGTFRIKVAKKVVKVKGKKVVCKGAQANYGLGENGAVIRL